MQNNHGDVTLNNGSEKLSLMYTIHAISHLSKDELELLKALQKDKSLLDHLKEDGNDVFPKIRKILRSFDLNSIEDVIHAVEDFNLFEIYNL